MTSSHPVKTRQSLENDLDQARQAGDASAEAALLLQLGDRARDDVAYDLAEGLYAQSWDTAQEAGDLRGVANALCSLVELSAWLLRDLSVSEMLMKCSFCDEALSYYEQLADRQGQVRIWIARADLEMETEITHQIALYEKALTIAGDSHDPVMQAEVLNRLSWVYLNSGDKEKAYDFSERAVALYEQSNRYWEAAEILRIRAHNDYSDETRIHYYERAIALYETLNMPRKIAEILERLGNSASYKRQYRLAAQYYAREISLHEQYGESISTYTQALYNLGQVSMHLKDYETAKACYLHNLALTDERWKDRFGCLLDLGIITAISGDIQSGHEYIQKAITVRESEAKNARKSRKRISRRLAWAEMETIRKHPLSLRLIFGAALCFITEHLLGHRGPIRRRLVVLGISNSEATL